jgi:quinone-reactive Ni/Fe-hydrogenase small subunit
LFADVTATDFNPKDSENETILITHGDRIDQYIVNNDRLKRFIGINTNIDLLALKRLIETNSPIDAAYLYSNRLMSEYGKLVCSCEGVHELELVEIIKENAVTSFAELKEHSKAGRTCGRCKQDICAIISATPVDPEEAARLRQERLDAAAAAELEKVRARIEKYNRLHPKNQLSADNFHEALESFEMSREFNRWISMITASMHLHPQFEGVVEEGVTQLNKIPIIWLELSDCTGNSEAFIKTSHPKVDDLILKYISLDYHELLMAASGDQSESALESILHNDSGKYVLIVEGAVPLGMDGKFLRIGPKGETGVDLLRRVAKNAAAVIAVGSCAYDGGVVAAEPNPTGAVGVAEALGRNDIINLPGCPTNPINIVGTLLQYIMFDEFPKLDSKNRPEWAYGFRVHDNCERRGHYDADEFVREWGDEGAKKGWCLFEMGCKGPYADLNCSLVKFNEGTSWPVQAGHGCFACGQGKIAFDSYANNRKLPEGEIEH